jgi:hypothetical protein
MTDRRQVLTEGSGGHSKALASPSDGVLELECLSRAAVEFGGDGVELVLGEGLVVGGSRNVSTQQVIGVSLLSPPRPPRQTRCRPRSMPVAVPALVAASP